MCLAPNAGIFTEVEKWVQKLDVRSKVTAGSTTNYVYRLKYGRAGEQVINLIERVSTPGRRVYSQKEALKPVLRGMGCQILTTSKGVLSDKEARAANVGGEVLVKVY